MISLANEGTGDTTGGYMLYKNKKMIAAALGVASIVLCASVQTVLAAPTDARTVEADTLPEALETVVTARTAPALIAESVGYDSVTFTWEATDQALYYELQQSVDKKEYSTVAVLSPEQELRYTVGNLYTAKSYYFRLVVTDTAGASLVSETVKAKTLLPATTVTRLEVDASSQVQIEWTGVEGAVFYRVYRSTTPVGGFKNVKSVYGTSYTKKVPTGVTYYYKIMPMRYNPDGKKVRGKCSATHEVTAELGVPVIAEVTNTANNSLSVRWSGVPNADRYAVYRSLKKNAGYQLVMELDKTSLSWKDTTVEAGTKYFYKVCAGKVMQGATNYGAESAPKSKWTKPPAPANLTITQEGSGGAVLTWESSKTASSYRIYRSQSSGTKEVTLATKLTGNGYTDTGLVAGETYTYRMEAVHGTLVSEKSMAVSVKIAMINVNTRTLFLGPGMSAFLSATTELPGILEWSSEDPTVVTVGADGTVIGVAPGKTRIIASVGAISTSVSVTVTDCQLNGIDVSQWQQEVNWKTVKDSGIRFAMLRLAYGNSKDKQFENYYIGAREQGIPVGVYCYTLAKSVDEGITEAEHLLKLLKGKELNYPIALDLESVNQINHMSKAERTELIIEYKRIIEEAGYQFVVYANLNWLNTYIDQSKLAEENVDIWIARYRSQSLGYGYEGGGNVRMWQYSSTGQVDGILDASGRYINVDLDVCYDGYE